MKWNSDQYFFKQVQNSEFTLKTTTNIITEKGVMGHPEIPILCQDLMGLN
jgi:hypothetical protein